MQQTQEFIERASKLRDKLAETTLGVEQEYNKAYAIAQLTRMISEVERNALPPRSSRGPELARLASDSWPVDPISNEMAEVEAIYRRL